MGLLRKALPKTLVAAAALLLLAAIPSLATDWGDYKLRLKADGHWYEFSYQELQTMSTDIRTSTRGVKQRTVISLTALIEKTGTTLDFVERVVVVSDTRSLVLDGPYLEHLDKLELKLGNIRPSIQPDNDTIWQALQPEFGRPRFKNIETIYVWVTQKKGQGRGDGKGRGKATQQEGGR